MLTSKNMERMSYSIVTKIFCVSFIVAACAACEPPPPQYILKAEVGEAAMVHWDDMKDQPKYIKVKKTPFEKRKAIMERRIMRERARGIYRKESRWDF
jgi:hypothetical protein